MVRARVPRSTALLFLEGDVRLAVGNSKGTDTQTRETFLCVPSFCLWLGNVQVTVVSSLHGSPCSRLPRFETSPSHRKTRSMVLPGCKGREGEAPAHFPRLEIMQGVGLLSPSLFAGGWIPGVGCEIPGCSQWNITGLWEMWVRSHPFGQGNPPCDVAMGRSFNRFGITEQPILHNHVHAFLDQACFTRCNLVLAYNYVILVASSAYV